MIFHYAVGHRFATLLRSGTIRPATANVPKSEKPVVWFSKHKFWEPTVLKFLIEPDSTTSICTSEDYWGMDIPQFRIGVNEPVAPHSWRNLRKLSCMDHCTGLKLERLAEDLDAKVGNWRGTFNPVPSTQWESIEFLNGHHWEKLSITQALLHPVFERLAKIPWKLSDGAARVQQ